MDEDGRRLLRLLSAPYDADQLAWLCGRSTSRAAVEARLAEMAELGLVHVDHGRWSPTTEGEALAASFSAKRVDSGAGLARPANERRKTP